MRLAAITALAFLVAAAPSASYAKAPKATDTPSVEEMYQQAQKAISDAAKDAAERARDPLREAIDNYRDRKIPLTDYQRLVDCLNNAKDENVQPYRLDAAQALVTRFTREDNAEPQVRTIRRGIGLAVLDLMKADAKKDEIGLRSVELLLMSWWRLKAMEFHFKANDKLDDRKKAHVKMKKYLEKGEN